MPYKPSLPNRYYLIISYTSLGEVGFEGLGLGATRVWPQEDLRAHGLLVQSPHPTRLHPH